MPIQEILPPMMGVIRSTAYQTPPDFSAYDSLNMWPFDYKTGRRAYSTRCPLSLSPDLSGIGEDVNMMGRVNGIATGKPNSMLVAATGGKVSWFDTSGSQWVAATGTQAENISTAAPVLSHAFLQELIIANPNGKPFVFSHNDGDVELMTETHGTVPDGLSMFCVWNGALVAAGDPANPHVLYMSRIGDAHDWDFSVGLTDTGGAFFTGGEDEGLLRGAISAIVPLSQDTLLVSTDEGLVAFQGHPRQGGVAVDVANIKIAGPQAWCKGPSGELYFASPHDIYRIAPDANPVPVPISRKAFPAGLGLLARFGPDTIFTYESRWNSVIIHRNTTLDTASFYGALLLDIETGGFHPLSFGTRVFAVSMEASPAGLPGVNPQAAIYASTVGIESFSEDNLGLTETFNASVVLNPLRIGGSAGRVAKLRSLSYQLGDVASSGLHISDPYEGMYVSVTAGKDAYDAINRLGFDSERHVSVEFPYIRNNGDIWYPNVTGNTIAIGVSRTSVGKNRRFSFESMELDFELKGRNRMLRYSP